MYHHIYMFSDNLGVYKSDDSDNLSQTRIKERIKNYELVTTKNYLMLESYKSLGIVSHSKYVNGILDLDIIIEEIKIVKTAIHINSYEIDELTSYIVSIQTSLISFMKLHGSNHIDDIISVIFGKKFLLTSVKPKVEFYDLLDYFHPTSAKYVSNVASGDVSTNDNNNASDTTSKSDDKNTNSIMHDINITKTLKEQLHVIDIGEGEHSLYMQIYGVKIFIKDTKENSCLVVQGYLNNITFKCLENHNFIRRRHDRLYDEVMSMPNLGSNAALFINYLDSFTLKEYLLTNDTNILSNFMGIVHHNNLVKTRALPRIISDFLKSSTFQKRSILMNLLCFENNSELSYLTYLLYDTISH